MKIYLLLLLVLLAGCGVDEAIRQPDLPVIDIGAYDIDRTYFVFQLESDRSVDRDMFPRIVITYRGHYENDRFRRFEFRIETYGRILAGLQEYAGIAYKTIDDIFRTRYQEYAGAELPFQEGENGIVTSVVIEVSQPRSDQKWGYEKGHPFTVGVSTLMFTTYQNIIRR